MKAVVFCGGEVGWSDRPDPQPGPRDLLVRVEAAGINRADLLQRAGHYPPPAGVPADQPGLECAGVVEETGAAVERFSPGDRVMSLLAGAGQAELALFDERTAIPVPDRCSTVEAGGFPEAFATAYDALFTQGGISMGDRALVTGAAGGVGMAGVQLAVAAGATVVASVRHEDFRDDVAKLGATAVAPDEAVALGPFDVVLELVGGTGVAGALNALAPQGRIVVIGIGAGGRTDLDLGLLMHRRATLPRVDAANPFARGESGRGPPTRTARPAPARRGQAKRGRTGDLPLRASGAGIRPLRNRPQIRQNYPHLGPLGLLLPLNDAGQQKGRHQR